MKRLGNVYKKICTYDNVLQAHYKAREGKSKYPSVQKVNARENYFISNIVNMLKNETYEVDIESYKVDTIIDRGKERVIYKLPYYPHRIIQWAIMLQLEDTFKKNFITDTYASIKGKGTHRCVYKIKKIFYDKPEDVKYCLKIDVKKYYPSINNTILINLLWRKIKDVKLMNLLTKIVFSLGEKGQPIGSLLSQYFGNIYLSSLDHFIKEELGVKYYFRYCDDMVILSNSKKKLRVILSKINKFLKTKLDVSVKENYQIFPTFERGLDFLGYRFFERYTLIRKRNIKNIKRCVRKYRNRKILSEKEASAINSYKGLLIHGDTYKFYNKYIKNFNDKFYINCKNQKVAFNF